MSHQLNIHPLKPWFIHHQRDLPWRKNRSPYTTWISEVMLQQTQVTVVIPYYQKWMDRLPSIKHVAQADLTEIIKLWEGLGYYSRARHLHSGAQEVLRNYGGELPEDPKKLATIKGLGPYTIGAIRSFAFKHKTPAVDGNVIRVLTRLYNIKEDISQGKTQKMLWHIAEKLLPSQEHWLINEALIELGALVCQRQPKCFLCPLRQSCQSYQASTQAELPYKTKRQRTEEIIRAVAVIRCKDSLLLQKVPQGKVMSDLYEFAYFPLLGQPITAEVFTKKVSEKLALPVAFHRWLAQQKHSFTRYRATLVPALFHTKEQKKIPLHTWHPIKELHKLPFSAGHRKIYQSLTLC